VRDCTKFYPNNNELHEQARIPPHTRKTDSLATSKQQADSERQGQQQQLHKYKSTTALSALHSALLGEAPCASPPRAPCAVVLPARGAHHAAAAPARHRRPVCQRAGGDALPPRLLHARHGHGVIAHTPGESAQMAVPGGAPQGALVYPRTAHLCPSRHGGVRERPHPLILGNRRRRASHARKSTATWPLTNLTACHWPARLRYRH
jgi:hypothetical protein